MSNSERRPAIIKTPYGVLKESLTPAMALGVNRFLQYAYSDNRQYVYWEDELEEDILAVAVPASESDKEEPEENQSELTGKPSTNEEGSSMTSAPEAPAAPVLKNKALTPDDPDALKFENVKIIREGDQIILPDGMSYKEAHVWLRRQEDAEEKVVAIADPIQCYPLDGIVALMRALKQIYGFASLEDTPGFFGSTPPNLLQVPMADGSFETAPLGRIAIPKWEGGFLDTNLRPDMSLLIMGEIKRKFESEVKAVITTMRQLLASNSIYKGKALMVDLSFMSSDNERIFHPYSDAPKFMDVKNIDESMLILNDVTAFELNANIFTIIEQTEACKRNSIPLKHGGLLMGPYGTGKTLTARVLAKKCVRNGWTFIYLKNAEHIANGLRLAQMYAPAVVFAEDIDQVLSGERDGEINEILNTMDGVDTKDKPIITILTTNRPEQIQPAFLRAGRIDTVIAMDAPDSKTSIKFVQKFARDENGRTLLVDGVDLTEAGKELAGFVPAFIAEAVQKAKRSAIHREGTDIVGKVTAEDVVLSAQALKKHIAMVNREEKYSESQIVASAVRVLHSYGEDGTLPEMNGEKNRIVEMSEEIV